MFRMKNVKMTEGPILKSVILYAIPIVLSGFLQILFNAADLAVVGNFADPDRATAATAAIGATTSFISLIVNTVMGLATGVNVTLAKSIGARDDDKSRRIVHTALLVSLFGGIAVGLVGFLISPFAMTVTKCPESAKTMAIQYMRIYFVGCPALFVYNFGSAILRTKGDTQRPLNFLALSGVLNIVLNLIFVTVFHMDAAGVALATSLSQCLSAFLTVRCLMGQDDVTRLIPSMLRIHKKELLGIVRYGLPSGLSTAMFSFANVQIQSAVNAFGESAVAGSAASGSLESFIGAGITAINAATVAFAGQNLGAGNLKRTKKVIFTCLFLTLVFTLVMGFGIYLIGDPLYRLYVPNDDAAIQAARTRAGIMMTTNFLLGIQNVLGAATQVFGYAFTITIISVVGVFGGRTLWMNVIYPLFGTLEMVFACYPASWAVITVANGIALWIAYRSYQKKVLFCDGNESDCTSHG
ncbi:MAG: MATE family efflux transporter [Ruminococcaceae bacterium]|nr:MATE family efflux transporter [Oscillospiraceae bacterium]